MTKDDHDGLAVTDEDYIAEMAARAFASNLPQSIMLALRELYAATQFAMQNEALRYSVDSPVMGQEEAVQARHDLDAAIEAEIANG